MDFEHSEYDEDDFERINELFNNSVERFYFKNQPKHFFIFHAIGDDMIVDMTEFSVMPPAPENFLDFNACSIRDNYLSHLLESLLLDTSLSHTQYLQQVELLGLTFWSGFWQATYPDDERLDEVMIECELLSQSLASSYDQQLVDQAYQYGRQLAVDINRPARD